MSPPHGLELTFMFTDMEDSTAQWRDEPELMNVVVEAHDRILRTAIHEHGGHVFGTAGDGFSAIFPSPNAAARSAIAIQTALLALPNVKVRIGLHTGGSYQRDGDHFGPEVNRAARISGRSLMELHRLWLRRL
jgi:class 3 adenylate cyclase